MGEKSRLAHDSREAPREVVCLVLGVITASGSEEKLSIMVGGGQQVEASIYTSRFSSPGTDLGRIMYQGKGIQRTVSDLGPQQGCHLVYAATIVGLIFSQAVPHIDGLPKNQNSCS